MLQMILVAAFLIAITTMACRPSATTSESDSGTSTQQPEASDPALLLSEESAISILQTFLQDCVLSWDGAYRAGKNKGQGYASVAAMRANDARDLSLRLGTFIPVIPQPTPLSPADYQLPPSAQEKKSWLMDLATGTAGDILWSAQYYGVTELGETEAETWVVIGPGFERAESQLAAPGRWKVYAGHRNAYYLDPPARLALEEYDSYDSCH